MKTRFHQLFLTLILLLGLQLVSSARDVKLTGKWVPTATPGGGFYFEIYLVDAAPGSVRKIMDGAFNPQSAAITDASFWTMLEGDGNSNKVIACDVRPVPAPRGGGYKGVGLKPKKADDQGKLVTIVAKKDFNKADLLVSGYNLSGVDSGIRFSGAATPEIDRNYDKGGKALATNLSVKQGKGSVYEFQAFAGMQDWVGDSYIRGQLQLDGRFNYQPKKADRLLDKIDLQGQLLATTPFQIGGRDLTFFNQFGVEGGMTSDQQFDNVTGNVGVTAWSAINGEWIQDFSKWFCLYPWHQPNRRAPAAIVSLNYEYAFNIHEDEATNIRERNVDTDRFRAQFYWTLQLANSVPINKLLPFDAWQKMGEYEVNLVVNTSFIKDFKGDLFRPDINLSLELDPVKPSKYSPSFTLTYLNGKTNTKFENYDALLAGIKVLF